MRKPTCWRAILPRWKLPGAIAFRAALKVGAGGTAPIFSTEVPLGADGWLATGDIVTADARGYLTFVDRKKDMIVVSGFKAWPGGGRVARSAGRQGSRRGRHARREERPGCLGLGGGSDPALTEQQVIDACHVRLARYKTPHKVIFRDALPKSPIGKILRRKLKEEGA
ncbi:MAG: AMP-binding protein [Rhodocyclaceae bacterium]|nr:AMP-binding protein [Rhodocyclaceae bacterium]